MDNSREIWKFAGVRDCGLLAPNTTDSNNVTSAELVFLYFYQKILRCTEIFNIQKLYDNLCKIHVSTSSEIGRFLITDNTAVNPSIWILYTTDSKRNEQCKKVVSESNFFHIVSLTYT